MGERRARLSAELVALLPTGCTVGAWEGHNCAGIRIGLVLPF